ncbi:hypothetical protein MMC25_006933 [Agyrium rufum]|nr:hypothetical protein [Agyrium rufum]
MFDVVANHFAWTGNHDTVDYSTFNPLNKKADFHPYCPLTNDDYNTNETAVEVCWLGDSAVELVDVNTESQSVITEMYNWISSLVSNYSDPKPITMIVDGLRIDTVRNVRQTFWTGFNEAAGVYCVGEIFDGDPSFTCPYQNYLDGVLNYPLWYPLTRAFQSTSGSISDLVNEVNTIKSTCKDSTLLGTFLENQDNPRFPSLTNDISLAKNAIAFTILADGIPIIYQGQEQHYSDGATPNNREALWLSDYNASAPLYGLIGAVNQARNHAIFKDDTYLTYMAYPIYSDSSTIAMRKGFDGNQIVGVFSNKGAAGASYTLTLGNTGITAGEIVMEMITCAKVTVDGSGNVAVPMAQGLPRIYYPAAQLVGSGICSL